MPSFNKYFIKDILNLTGPHFSIVAQVGLNLEMDNIHHTTLEMSFTFEAHTRLQMKGEVIATIVGLVLNIHFSRLSELGNK